MTAYPVPTNEATRIDALRSYQILDSPPDLFFDNIVKVASIICGTPIALVSLVDADRQWFKAKVGIGAEQTERDIAFCTHAIMDNQIMEIEDATRDERFMNNPLVLGSPKIRFYAGQPLITENQCAMGTLCVIDDKPRKLTEEQTIALKSLGYQVVALLELHRNYVELKKLSKLKDEFIQIASHDLKNPLQTILGASSLIGALFQPGRLVTDEGCDLLSRIPGNARQMQRIIEDFLDFQALEDGQLSLDRHEVDLNALAREVHESQKDYAEGKDIALHMELATELPASSADAARIRQVMENLIGNAIKFSPGGESIQIRTRQEHTSVKFEVRDRGPGIPGREVDKLFAKYERLSNRPTGPEKSTGLGLSICKALIDLHGGEIGACNNPDQGATFWFALRR